MVDIFIVVEQNRNQMFRMDCVVMLFDACALVVYERFVFVLLVRSALDRSHEHLLPLVGSVEP